MLSGQIATYLFRKQCFTVCYDEEPLVHYCIYMPEPRVIHMEQATVLFSVNNQSV